MACVIGMKAVHDRDQNAWFRRHLAVQGKFRELGHYQNSHLCNLPCNGILVTDILPIKTRNLFPPFFANL